MSVFETHYAQMAQGLTAISSRYSSLLDSAGVVAVNEFIDAREYGLAYEMLDAAFEHHPSSVDAMDREELADLGRQMRIKA